MILYNTKKKSTKSCTNVFLGQSSKAIEIETKINTQALIKVTSFCTAKETIKKKKKNYRLGEHICKWWNQQGINLQNTQTAHRTTKKQTTQLKNKQKI